MTTETGFKVECSWCKQLMRPGDPAPENLISHTICCECHVKYFPTLSTASDHQWQLIKVKHEGCAPGNNAPGEQMSDINVYECTVCRMLHEDEPVTCECHDDYED